MSNEQKSRKGNMDVENILDGADTMDKVEWNDFWENCNVERDLQEAYKDLRDAYQTFD